MHVVPNMLNIKESQVIHVNQTQDTLVCYYYISLYEDNYEMTTFLVKWKNKHFNVLKQCSEVHDIILEFGE